MTYVSYTEERCLIEVQLLERQLKFHGGLFGSRPILIP